VKILKFYSEIFSQKELVAMIKQPDYKRLNTIEYAQLTENSLIIEMVNKMLNG
jgi:hypothetical protein